MLPLIVFATGVVFHNYENDRQEATKRVLETARGIRFTLDAEMRRMTGGLQVLALTNALRSGDFSNFGDMAAGFLDQYGKDGVILVTSRTGQVLFSSMTPYASELPSQSSPSVTGSTPKHYPGRPAVIVELRQPD